jgi:hypothetical protein
MSLSTGFLRFYLLATFAVIIFEVHSHLLPFYLEDVFGFHPNK